MGLGWQQGCKKFLQGAPAAWVWLVGWWGARLVGALGWAASPEKSLEIPQEFLGNFWGNPRESLGNFSVKMLFESWLGP